MKAMDELLSLLATLFFYLIVEDALKDINSFCILIFVNVSFVKFLPSNFSLFIFLV